MLSDIAIATAAEMRPITDIAAKLGLSDHEIETHGRYKAKVPLGVLAERGGVGPRGGREGGAGDGGGALVLVTGVNPTPAGEGKSTMSVGLADALTLRKKNPVLCLREPSLGPVFGIKGGAAGGGYSQVVPMDDINLHFTGDFHAITSAHALLSAMLDNHLHRRLEPVVDPRRVTWRRCVDMNDRALRNVVIGLGGPVQGTPREDGFSITAASEVMAIFCLASDLDDLNARLGRIIVGSDYDRNPIRAEAIGAPGAMTVLLKDALAPNLVQTLGGTPAFVHGGPFANIAHGCNSLIATRAGLALGDIVVTEAGFGADLGAEKFFDIKCRVGELHPDAVVIVATIRALKMNGGAALQTIQQEDVDALQQGVENLLGHVENVGKFGVPAVVAINKFATDTDAEIQVVLDACEGIGVRAAVADPHGEGGDGVLEVADIVSEIIDGGEAHYRPLYPLDMGLAEKIETIAREIYGAEGVDFVGTAGKDIERLESYGLREVPVCIAKTQYSFSDDPKKLGRPRGFRIGVREVTPSAGAGFVVAKTGDIMTMPGVSAQPAALNMKVMPDGSVEGLF
jgi:formate--tetrahydrofolate ligase